MHQMLGLALLMLPGPADARADAVAAAEKRCLEAEKGPAPAPMVRRPVEKFDECIVAEANKWSMETRKAICALGKSGGPCGSTVEVYMTKDGRCRTDYE
ncbi:MAG: hypothetical protein JSR45_08260 [Proteobacteria bacterium]|nr:hypothetical protein [Pseudomonadota bacterium]